MRFEFSAPGRIIFGPGVLAEVPAIARQLDMRWVLVVHGWNAERVRPLLQMLRETVLDHAAFAVPYEPTTELIEEAVQLARESKCDGVIGIGGGSVIDTAKAVAGLATNPGTLFDYLEIIGDGKPLVNPALPWIAIPTTAGAGTEVTKNAVITSLEDRVKVSLRSPLLLARAAIVDPELTRDLPPQITAATGLDALTQVIEPYVCTRANPMTDGLCTEGMRLVARSLRRAFENGREDMAAREDMLLAALLGGLALANAGLGAVHGFAAPIGGMFPRSPHGAVCAALLPHVMQANLRALREREPEGPALRRYAEVAQLLTGGSEASADDGANWVASLCNTLCVPGLGAYGIAAADVPRLVEKAAKASSMKPNPVALTGDELAVILHAAIPSEYR